MSHYPNLNQQKALIWRIVHKDNLPWLFDNGLHSANSPVKAAHWTNIGNIELIDRRAQKIVPIQPMGTLNDYIPFYFTPFSPMMYNIHTGRGGVQKRSNEEIVILVSSLDKISQSGHSFVYTDRHAYVALANFYNNLDQLDQIDWPLLQARDFQRSYDDLDKVERYQAEALIHEHLPISDLIGIVCYTDAINSQIQQLLKQRNMTLDVRTRTEWYFQ